MKILISGAKGQLVREIVDVLTTDTEDFEVIPYTKPQWNITDYDRNRELFEMIEPDIYIHGASIHDVGAIYKDSRLGAKVNIAATHNLVKLCNEIKTKFINFSTDYVFGSNRTCDGLPPDSYREHDSRTPLNLYGIMKYSIEMMLENDVDMWANVRVCGLFSRHGSRAKDDSNFPLMILEKIRRNEQIQVVNDQYVTIGYCKDIANQLATLITSKYPKHFRGHYHFMNEGITTWYDLAKFICNVKGYDKIEPVSSYVFYSDFKRARTTALENTRTDKMPSWQDAIVRFMKEIDEI